MVAIRAEAPGDQPGIRAVHLAAFPTRAEADLVERLVADGDSKVSLIAEQGGLIVGHVLLSKMAVQADGAPVRALGLAPVAVLPERQGGGIGTRLIEAALARAREAGAQIVFVLGEPDYYGRFRFSAEAARPYDSPYAGPYFQAVALGAGESPPTSGTALYARAFEGLE